MISWLLAMALPAADAFTPVGEWSVSSAAQGCSLARSYTDGKSTMLLGFRPLTGANSVKLVLLTADTAKRRFGGGFALVWPGPRSDEKPGTHAYFTRLEPGIGKRLVVVRLKRDDVARYAGAGTMSILATDLPPVRAELTGLDAGLAQLARCEAELSKSWGFDPALVAVPAQGIHPETWAALVGYPRQARVRDVGGETSMRVTVSAEGRVTDCVVLAGSGTALIDQRSCEVMRDRARYKPAIGRDGAPIASLQAMTFIWGAVHTGKK